MLQQSRSTASARATRSLKTNLITSNIADETIFINMENQFFPVRIKDIIYCFSKDPLITFVIRTANAELLGEISKKEATGGLKRSGIRRHDVTTKMNAHKDLLEWQTHMTMKELIADFQGLNFYPISQRLLINFMHIEKFTKGVDMVKMSNGEELQLSKTRRKDFLQKIGRG